MATTYDPAPPEILDLLAEVRAEYHPDLDAAGVTIGVLMASNPDGGAVKVGGHDAAAAIRVTNARDRMQGMPDCSLLIDADRWAGLEDGGRRALLDHELCHPVPRPLPPDPDDPEAPARFLLDDAGRPKLKTRKDDWCLTGFDEVVGRHGRDALEAQAVRTLAARYWQELFPWGDDQPPGVPLARRGATA